MEHTHDLDSASVRRVEDNVLIDRRTFPLVATLEFRVPSHELGFVFFGQRGGENISQTQPEPRFTGRSRQLK